MKKTDVKNLIRKIMVYILVIGFVFGGHSKVISRADTVYSRTYSEMIDYDYGEKNKGFYMVPDEDGKYPVIFMFHGAGEKSSSNWEYRAYLKDTVNKWVALGYMDPMVIVVPNIEREDEKDNWSCYAFNYYVSKNRFGTLLDKIKNGESEFDDKVDHSAKFSVTGFSMGGVESLYIGSSYKNSVVNVGACSPSYMYYHVSQSGSDDGWVKKDNVNFTSDPDAHLFMGYGTKEESGFRESVERYIAAYKENKTESQKDFVVYGTYPGGHEWSTFSREIFCFIYYMKYDELPDDDTIEEACENSNLNYAEDQATATPSVTPTATSSVVPSAVPTSDPSAVPTSVPTSDVSATPSVTPSAAPTTELAKEKVDAKQKNTKFKKLTRGEKSFTVKWKKISGITGYEIQYSLKKNFKNSKTVDIKKKKTTSKKISKLKSKNKYYVRIRTYKKENGEKIYSKWSKAKTVKTK